LPKDLKEINLRGKMFPASKSLSIYMTEDLKLWACSDCGNFVYWANQAGKIDTAVEMALRKVSSQLIEQIIQKSKISMADLAHHMGVSATHLSSVRRLNKTPSTSLYRLLMATASDPQLLLQLTSPDRNPSDANLLLHG